MDKLLILSLLLFAAVFSVVAQIPEGYEKPVRIELGVIEYPYSQQRENSSGAVDMMFMVDKEGKPFEILVLNSSLPAFSPPSINAIRKAKFTPAKVNGEPVEGMYQMRINYRISQQRQAASVDFSKYYSRAMNELAKNDASEEKIRKHLMRMDKSSTKNLYALTYAGLVKFQVAEKFGTAREKIAALKDIVLFDIEEDKKYKVLDDDQSLYVMAQLLELLVNTERYGEFLKYYQSFETIDEKIKSGFAPIYEKVVALQTSDSVVSTKVLIGEQGSTASNLFKRSFMVEGDAIESLKLRCYTKFLEIPFKSGQEYQLPESWGTCNLELIGTPGAEVTLFQL